MPKTTKDSGFTDSEIKAFIRIQKMKRKYDFKAQKAYAEEKSFAIGFERGLNKVARNMLTKGYSVAEVIRVTNLSRGQVRALNKA